MSTPHKASAEQWARQEEFAAGSDMLCCLLELRARVEALESVKPTTAEPDRIIALEQRVAEHIRAQSVLTAALVKRIEALEGVPADGAIPDGGRGVPGGITALEQRITELQTLFWAHSHPAAVEPTTEPRQHLFATNDTFIKALNDLAEKTNRSKAEVLRDALNLYIKAVDEWDQGKSIAFVSMDEVQPSEENQ